MYVQVDLDFRSLNPDRIFSIDPEETAPWRNANHEETISVVLEQHGIHAVEMGVAKLTVGWV